MKIYLDTNVLRNCLKNRHTLSIRLMELIRTKKIECVTSIFTMMELMDIEKDYRFFSDKLLKGWEINKINRERIDKDLTLPMLNDIAVQLGTLKQTYNFLQFVILIEAQGWQTTVDICMRSNISASDALHLSSALGSGCNILVTEDSFFKKEGNRLSLINQKEEKIEFKIVNSEEAIKILEDEEKQKQDNSKSPIEQSDSKEGDELEAEAKKQEIKLKNSLPLPSP